VKKPYRDKGLPNSSEMKNLFVISTVKTAEDGSGCIVRGYNISPEPLEVTLVPWRYFGHAEILNLSETTVAVLNPGSDGEVTFPVRQHEIATVKFME
jgi:alpha-mannosidase